MNIKVTCDSTADLSQKLSDEYNITYLPLSIGMGEDYYLDRTEITAAKIFAYHDETGELCKSSAINIGQFMKHFEKYSKGYDAVIHISIGSHFSSCYQNACMAAKEFNNIYVIDSENLSSGQGLVALKAAQLVKEGKSVEELIFLVNEYKKRVEMSFVIDTMEYLSKGGRCPSVISLATGIMKIKPTIEVVNGEMKVGKLYRGQMAHALKHYVTDKLANRDDIDYSVISIPDASCSEDLTTLVENMIQMECNFTIFDRCSAGCVISTHCGPNCLGLAFVHK